MSGVPNSPFFAEVEKLLAEGTPVRIRCTGGSMRPLIRGNGQTVVVSPCEPEKLRRGQVVLFRHNGGYVIHRLLKREGGRFTIMGDGNLYNPEYASAEDIVGVVTTIVKSDGRTTLSCSSLRWRLPSWLWMNLRRVRRPMLAIYDRIFPR